MNISKVIELLEEFKTNVVYSDITSEVHYGCDCGCGGDSYDDESWAAMSDTYDETEEKVKKFCDENNLTYDWADNGIADEYSTKISFNSLFNLFSNCNIGAIKDDYDVEQDYWEMKDYYAEDLEIFLNFCESLGFEKDKNNF